MTTPSIIVLKINADPPHAGIACLIKFLLQDYASRQPQVHTIVSGTPPSGYPPFVASTEQRVHMATLFAARSSWGKRGFILDTTSEAMTNARSMFDIITTLQKQHEIPVIWCAGIDALHHDWAFQDRQTDLLQLPGIVFHRKGYQELKIPEQENIQVFDLSQMLDQAPGVISGKGLRETRKKTRSGGCLTHAVNVDVKMYIHREKLYL